jgi:hypothetical protein
MKQGAGRGWNPGSHEETAMIILVLAFLTLFLAVFSPCLLILQKSAQAKEIEALKRQLQLHVEAQEDAAWRRNKQMIMY